MTLDTCQYALPIRTVLLGRVVLVIESHLAVPVGLAVFPQDHLFRLRLALLFLDRNHPYTTERQNQDQKYFHEDILATKKNKRQKILLGHAEGWAGVAAFAVFEREVAAEGAFAVVAGEAGRAAGCDEVL
jgi:hypothetical protein